MIYRLGDFTLRPPEPADIEALYRFKNDPDIAKMLVGFSTGYSKADLANWVEFHRKSQDEVLWVIAENDDRCIGHMGLYRIDHRIGCAEYGILIGESARRGRGLGRACMKFAVEYGFRELNLNRIYAHILAHNEASIRMCRSLGFDLEGCLRQAQFKSGSYVDVVMMSALRDPYFARASREEEHRAASPVSVQSGSS